MFSSVTRPTILAAVLMMAVPVVAGAVSEVGVGPLLPGQNHLALSLLRHSSAEGRNVVVSPYGIATALTMTWAGASGETRAQMSRALRLGDDDRVDAAVQALNARLAEIGSRGSVQLNAANRLFPQKAFPLRGDFLERLSSRHGADVLPLDYAADPEAARLLINRWVAAETKGKITDLIGQGILNALTRLVLANAVYFKGDWATPFDPARTGKEAFHPSAGPAVTVDMMRLEGTFSCLETEDAAILRLPYAGHELEMTLILPAKGRSLSRLVADLTPEELEWWCSRASERPVRIWLPRFSVEYGARLDRVLGDLGMADAFDPNRADFSGMDGRPDNLYIGAVLHEATIEVNEKGAEAAAATAVVMLARGLPPPGRTMEFRADRPFLFFIRDTVSGIPLFAGRVENPTSK